MPILPLLTATILAGFGLYGVSWYFGAVEGDFALVLLIATIVTGAYWLAERFHFLPQRLRAAAELEANDAKRRADLAKQGITQVDGDVVKAKAELLAQPWWLDWTAGLFPVIISVFFLRSFVVEPFKIPSGSMIPTLEIGDLILVNKFHYGLRLPVLNTKITQGATPQRGDVMVFRYPPKPSVNYIKRVIGLPGDTVAYLNKQLTINGQPVAKLGIAEYLDDSVMQRFPQFEEDLLGVKHRILNDDHRPAYISGASAFDGRDGCTYTVEGVTCKVPEGQYFMMGDNRDNSADSRYWGFVPEANIVGKAFFVWMHFWDFKRIGSFQ